MQRFIAVHTLPGFGEEQLKALLKNHPPFPQGTVCRWTYADFETGKAFCDWVAPSKEAILEWFQATSMPYDALYPVRLVDWALQEVEPAPVQAVPA
jgi:uncharacterized protein DUF4242